MKGSCLPTRLTNIDKLKLPYAMEKQVKEVVHKHRMQYELWAESAKSYPDLMKSLAKRYKRVPATPKPLLWARAGNRQVIDQIILNSISSKTMLRRSSRKKN